MYDLNKNNYITRDEFKFILNMMVGSNVSLLLYTQSKRVKILLQQARINIVFQITADQLESIADRTITEADLDSKRANFLKNIKHFGVTEDGRISFEEFCRVSAY